MITVEMQVQDETLFEEIVEFLWGEVVMRQPCFTTIQWNKGSWFNLLELRPLVLQLRNGHKEQTVGFEDPNYVIGQRTDLSQPGVMNNLD